MVIVTAPVMTKDFIAQHNLTDDGYDTIGGAASEEVRHGTQGHSVGWE